MPLEFEGTLVRLAVGLTLFVHIVKYLMIEATDLWMFIRTLKGRR